MTKKWGGQIIIGCSLALFIQCSKSSDNPVTPSTFKVTVNNGYGGGDYKVGDTVHVFTNHYSDAQLFDKWSGDVSGLNSVDEWHAWLVMPANNVTINGSLKSSASFMLKQEQIQGKDRLKPVYYYLPTGHKGFVYLLHGTGGTAAFVASSYEFQQVMKDLAANNLGVIITEAEEATTGTDLNGDGKLRWQIFPVDTVNNVDYSNIRLITNNLYTRGLTSRSKLRYSIGMSNGAFYSASLSAIYRFKAAVAYCGQGDPSVIQNTITPLQYCMARFDSNDGVGQTGNATALSNSNALNARNVCSKYFINQRSPIYAERFARRGDITTTKSTDLFNELKSKNYIDSKGFFKGYSSSLVSAFQSSPAGFPVLNSLTPAQRSFALEQIDLAVADHQMYSDYNRATMKFLNSQCQ